MTLDQEYQQAITDQRTHLMQMQENFNKLCEDAKVAAQEKLKTVPEGDNAARESILKEQKATLEAALAKLKEDVAQSTRDTMKKLEAIIRRKEEEILADLEKQLAAL